MDLIVYCMFTLKTQNSPAKSSVLSLRLFYSPAKPTYFSANYQGVNSSRYI